MYTPRVGLMDQTAQLEAAAAAAADAEAEAAQSVPAAGAGGNGAVFRRMQALRRAAQLAEAAAGGSPARNSRNR